MPIKNNLFELTFPDGWKETTVFTFEGPDDSGIKHNLVAVVLPGLTGGVDIVNYAKRQMEATTAQLPGFDMVAERPADYFGTDSGYEICFKYRPSDDIVYFQKQWYFSINKKVYLFTATFNKKTLKTIGTEIEAIVRSLKTGIVVKSQSEEE